MVVKGKALVMFARMGKDMGNNEGEEKGRKKDMI